MDIIAAYARLSRGARSALYKSTLALGAAQLGEAWTSRTLTLCLSQYTNEQLVECLWWYWGGDTQLARLKLQAPAECSVSAPPVKRKLMLWRLLKWLAFLSSSVPAHG